MDSPKKSVLRRMKSLVVGRARNPLDRSVFHKLSLIAFFAWVGLGADGLSSSCYGPSEAFLALGGHQHLGLFVGLATAITVLVISISYSQIVEVFPSGGGGYLVASKLISPHAGMVSGCALLVDYVLTISVSIASGADAIFSFLPSSWQPYKLVLAVGGVIFLTLLNLRGVKESVVALVPIFLVFVLTHIFAVIYAVTTHASSVQTVIVDTGRETSTLVSQIGFFGVMLLILRAYSMGAGTFTGIEAVSNGITMLREPRVKTAKRTMAYMAVSLAFMALGLMFAYVLCHVEPRAGETVNAALFRNMTAGWNTHWAFTFSVVTLLSEGAILFVAAQTGFLGGPQVLSYMALDRWIPTRFGVLSDRLVTENGILLMGIAALVTLLLTGGNVGYLVVLYSINVFITFCLSQSGMVRHWWSHRRTAAKWAQKLFANGLGLALSLLILISVSIIKFYEGAWITFIVTGSLVAIAIAVRRHYDHTKSLLSRLNELAKMVETPNAGGLPLEQQPTTCNPEDKTAVILVSGFNGIGLHSAVAVVRLFGQSFKNFVFVQVGVVDAGSFKGSEAVDELRQSVPQEVDRYVNVMRRMGYYAETYSSIGIDVIDEVTKLEPEIRKRFPNCVFFGGQLVFTNETILTRFLHNYLVFALQRRFFLHGTPFVILPIRVDTLVSTVP